MRKNECRLGASRWLYWRGTDTYPHQRECPGLDRIAVGPRALRTKNGRLMKDLLINRRGCGSVVARLWPPSHNRLGSPSHEKAQPTVALVCQSRQSRHALAANDATLPVGCLAVLRLARPCNHVPVRCWTNIAPNTPQCGQPMQYMLALTPLCKPLVKLASPVQP